MARMPPAERASFLRIAWTLIGLGVVGVVGGVLHPASGVVGIAMILTGAAGRLLLWIDERWG